MHIYVYLPPFRKEAPVVASKTYPVKKRLLPRLLETMPDTATDCCRCPQSFRWHSHRLLQTIPKTARDMPNDCQN